jgi:hypothetical protein
MTALESLTARVAALEREVMVLNPGIRLPDNPSAESASVRLLALQEAVRAVLAAPQLGLIRDREMAIAALRKAYEESL